MDEVSYHTEPKPRLAVFAGPTATILNSPPLVSTQSNPPLRAQRLAAPVTAYVEVGSAHPLESEAPDLSNSPDGYISSNGEFRETWLEPNDVPVYRTQLKPEDGLFLLPYHGTRTDGACYGASDDSLREREGGIRQTFYPDACRVFEEIDRFGLDQSGQNNILSRLASYDFLRAAPPGGYTREAAEVRGADFFPYSPPHLAHSPHLTTLAAITNHVQSVVSTDIDGVLWLEGSPAIEETLYWLNLLICTKLPICGTMAQRPHGTLSADGDRNVVDAIIYLTSKVWGGSDGIDELGVVLVADELVFTSRDVHKVDGRPGGFRGSGETNGVLASVGLSRPAHLLVTPTKRHTWKSAVNLRQLPRSVNGVSLTSAGISTCAVEILDSDGTLKEDVLPNVRFARFARYASHNPSDVSSQQLELRHSIVDNLHTSPRAGFILEGNTPYGSADVATTAVLQEAVLSGMPVVCVGRGSVGGTTPALDNELFISGSNLTATKARLLLMACLLKYGASPHAINPQKPTQSELDAVRVYTAALQEIFDTH